MEGQTRASRLIEPYGIDVVTAFEVASKAVAEVERNAAYSVQGAREGEQNDMLVDPCEEIDECGECGEEGGEKGLDSAVGGAHEGTGCRARRGGGICCVRGRFWDEVGSGMRMKARAE